MIRLSSDSARLGDTLRLVWDLPAGANVLVGPRSDDSLALAADTAHPGQWLLQPLAVGLRGGDSLRALGPSGDTLTEIVPPWRAVPVLGAEDTAIATLLPPRDRPVPFPLFETGLVLVALGLALLGLWLWKRQRDRRPPPPPPPVPTISVHERVLTALAELESASLAGQPPRDTAFRAGILLRELHGEILGWPESIDSTSAEWRARVETTLPGTTPALREFLAEADPLRYADDLRDAAALLRRARDVVAATPMQGA